MNCEARGGDVLAYHMAVHGLDFVNAAKALGAWVDDGRSAAAFRPTALSPRDALEVLAFEATLTAVAAGNLANGSALTDHDLSRLFVAAGRINHVVRAFA
jgi:hypothetical protein